MCLALLRKSAKEHLWEIQKGGTQRRAIEESPDPCPLPPAPCLRRGMLTQGHVLHRGLVNAAGMARPTEESPDFTSGANKEPPIDIEGW